MHAPSHPNHKIEPEFLGPVSDRPLAEKAAAGEPTELFPGVSAFLGGRDQRRRRDQWNAAGPLAERMLRPDEHVLYVAHGMQLPPALHYLAMGYMALSFHQVMLIFTDTRLIEVLLGVRGNRPDTRVRSFPWAGVRDLKMSFSKLSLAPQRGKKQGWRIPLRGDRKLLKALVERLKPRLLTQGAAMGEPLPLWHCPKCSATVPANPQSCESCKTTFRSTRLAAALSMAFPGAGLLYAGHPFLALGDFIGEVIFYAVFVLMMLEAEPGGIAMAAGIGAFLFLLTKLESVHLSQILVSRSKPETPPGRAKYQRAALIGGLASLLLIGGAFPLAGAARAVVDRDLDIADQDGFWQGSRNTAEWQVFGDDPAARSQWESADGARVTLFAYPQRVLDSVAEFRTGVRRALEDQGMTILKDDEQVPAPFVGFRFVTTSETEEGESVSSAQYFVLDEKNRDIHQAVAAVLEDDGAMAESMVGELLSHARWIDSRPPDRPAAEPQASAR